MPSHTQLNTNTVTSPLERTTPLRSTKGERIGAATIALLSLTLLATAAFLTPNAQGHATHTQLGMAKCAWVVWFDRPCPTCGMTTSFSHAGEGAWISALLTQPMGALLALLSTMIFWGATHQAVTGSRISTVAIPFFQPKPITLMILLAGAAWIYKLATWS